MFPSFSLGVLRRRHFATRTSSCTFTKTDERTLNRDGRLVPNYQVCRERPETCHFFSVHLRKNSGVVRHQWLSWKQGKLERSDRKWPPQVSTGRCLFYAGLCHLNIHHLRLHSAPDQKINIQRLMIITQCPQNHQGCQV